MKVKSKFILKRIAFSFNSKIRSGENNNKNEKRERGEKIIEQKQKSVYIFIQIKKEMININ